MPRVFEVVTDEYHPVTGEHILSEETIKKALSHRIIKEWAYILHDKDVYTQHDIDAIKKELKSSWADNRANITETEDEYVNSGLRVKAGDHKNNHWHIPFRTDRNMDVNVIAKWFEIPSYMIHLPKGGNRAFLDKVEYITHEHPHQQAQGKYLYPDEEVHSNFNFRQALTIRAETLDKYGTVELSRRQQMMMHVLKEGWTMKQCQDEDPLTYADIRSKLPPLRLDYLLRQPPVPFRISIYVDGPGGAGKGSICEYIGQRLFPDCENPCFVVGNDPRVAFDGYDGEPVLIWEDYRAYKFVSNFTREGTFAIFDSHPKVQSQQVKNSRIVLQNVVNIVNGVEPYVEFLNGLAGNYTDRDGNEHKAEDKNQVLRRFQQIICIREEEFDVLFNRGFIDRDSRLYAQYDTYARVRGSMKRAMQVLEGKAKEHVLTDMSQPVIDCFHMIEDSHNSKIESIDDIPEEFAHYGEVMTTEEIKQQDEERLQQEYNEYMNVELERFQLQHLPSEQLDCRTFEWWMKNVKHKQL